MSRALILDCDPGIDDAVALLLAAGHPDVELAAITAVGGNQTLERVTENARALADLAGLSGVPVAAGSPRPLVRPLQCSEHVHGPSGMGHASLPKATYPLDERHAAQVIIDTVMSRPAGTVTLAPIGPLTNIALAARLEPAIIDRVDEVILMGGAYGHGNVTPVAEFNIACDPEAAQITFTAGWRVTMVGLDVTYTARADAALRERIAALRTDAAHVTLDALRFYTESYQRIRGIDAPPLHDPCAVAAIIDPTLLTTRPAPIEVELAGSLTTGMTVADLRPEAPTDGTTHVATAIDVPRFHDLLVDSLERLG